MLVVDLLYTKISYIANTVTRDDIFMNFTKNVFRENIANCGYFKCMVAISYFK